MLARPFTLLLTLSLTTLTTALSLPRQSPSSPHSPTTASKTRTVITTDLEQDDLTSLIRYLLYTPDLDTQGIIYSASSFHWQGDFANTSFYLPGREYTTPQTSWRWTGNRTVQDIVIPAYAQVYPNLLVHDPNFPSPQTLQDLVKIGNVDFEGEMERDSEGAELIKRLILDDDPRTLYLQAWGGTNTIARALKAIETQHAAPDSNSKTWASLQAHISGKVVIMASGFQDETYDSYIAPHWPDLQVRSVGVGWTAYNCNLNGTGNVRGLPDDHVYFTGAWIRENIQTGPYGRLYRSWLDGQHMPGDQLDVFGNTSAFPVRAGDWCQPLGKYDFLGEGDDGTYLPLLSTGMQDPGNPGLGGWGGRAERNESVKANLWQSVAYVAGVEGVGMVDGETGRFIAAAQNDFAARMQWGLKGRYEDGNHPPVVRVQGGGNRDAAPGESLKLESEVSDPDGDRVEVSWWQYVQEGSYDGVVEVTGEQSKAVVKIPNDAKVGETISIIVEATDDGEFPLTRYDRVIITVR